MNKKVFIPAFVFYMLIPFLIFPITLVRVGYIDLDLIIKTYTTKYLETEISIRDEYVDQLQETYNNSFFQLEDEEKRDIQIKIQDQNEVLNILHYNIFYWENSGELKDDIIYQIIQRDIMEAIQKTSELEGFSLLLDNTGNFIYGSEDINLTDKVLFRLDEKLLDIQDNEPKAPLSLELEEDEEIEVLSNEE